MSSKEFRPDWVSAPGDTIADILRERNLSATEFAQQMGQPPEVTNNLLQGRLAITIALARCLEHVLGSSVEFWMSRDFQYRQNIAKRHETDEKWLSELPIGDMIKYEWLKPAPHPSDELNACLRFFDVPDVRAWQEKYAGLHQLAVFRTSRSFDSRPAAVAAWLRQGEILAKLIDCMPWDAERFRETLPHIRLLTREKDPQRFIPTLQKLCAISGVAVAVIRAPSGCRASGATRFLTKDKALLLLSFRYLTDDHLWFTFFHEAGHLLLHGERGFFLEGADMPSSIEEDEANEFAAHTLLRPEFQPALLRLRADARTVIKFAMQVGVSPGIIVGQLQHLGRIRQNQLNSLKRRFEWPE